MRKLLFLITLLLPLTGSAHVNSPNVYFDGHAGPYHLLVTIKPPAVIPGIAQIQIRATGNDVEQIKILPLRMVGMAAKLAPTADAAQRSASDPRLFTGQLWIMARGSWKVQVEATGKQGAGELAVPLPAVSSNSARMQATLGTLLAVLGVALVLGLAGIIGAAARDADLRPGDQAPAEKKRRGAIRMAITTLLLIVLLVFANRWWGAEASANAKLNYKQPHVQTELTAGNLLRLQLENPNLPEKNRFGIESPDKLVLNDLVPDHGHLMHLFLVRMPDMQSFWHLHPDQTSEAQFAVNLPAMPVGRYQICADIVHRSGFPETQVGEMEVRVPPAGETMRGDDSGVSDLPATETVAQLSGGYRMVWLRDQQPLKAGEPVWFRFRIEDKDGKPAHDMENYMGMAGHAVFLSGDGKIFAHVHPAGSAPMAALEIAGGSTAKDDMATMEHDGEVSFPYGFPKTGDYRIFVQVKRNGHVETGVFRAQVGP
ncbi:MAG TPA: hypothetical protein VF532_24150 [Candidatus Angelobacter sp.]